MRGGHLSNPEVARLLRPFVVSSWHGGDPAQMPADVRRVYTDSPIPKTTNVYMFLLDSRGQLVHSFHGLQGRRNTGSTYPQEIAKARALLKLADEPPAADRIFEPRLPDFERAASGRPAGVRRFVRPRQGAGRWLVVEKIAFQTEQWQRLAYPEQAREIEADALKNVLVQMYPPAIRTADQRKPFTRISGSLRLEPAGSTVSERYAVLRGEVHLAKGDESESAFQDRLEAVLTYQNDSCDVQSLRGVVDGNLYRIRGTQSIPLVAAIESRPDAAGVRTRP
jgi:hypothetical protein